PATSVRSSAWRRRSERGNGAGAKPSRAAAKIRTKRLGMTVSASPFDAPQYEPKALLPPLEVRRATRLPVALPENHRELILLQAVTADEVHPLALVPIELGRCGGRVQAHRVRLPPVAVTTDQTEFLPGDFGQPPLFHHRRPVTIVFPRDELS